VSNNFIDPTGAAGLFYPPSGSGLTFTNNVNMLTGTTVQPNGTSFFKSDVSVVTAVPSMGTETVGNAITITLGMDQPMLVTGTPTLTLNDGGAAIYVAGSGSATLTFKYTVAASDSSVSNLAITGVTQPVGTSIRDGAGNAANLSGAQTSFTGLS